MDNVCEEKENNAVSHTIKYGFGPRIEYWCLDFICECDLHNFKWGGTGLFILTEHTHSHNTCK